MKIFLISVFIGTIMLVLWNNAVAGRDINQSDLGLAYWHGDKTQPRIALTFDDGPNEPYTSEILEILNKHNIKATFFLVGKNVERYPDTVRKIIQDGHEIGNHTYNHPYLLLKTKSQVRYEIAKTEKTIMSAANIKPVLFRSPYGIGAAWIYRFAAEQGYLVIEWSVTGHNGGADIAPERIERNILSKVKNGSIILLHDGDRLFKKANRRNVVKALPKIIDSLQAMGYEFVSVSELIGNCPECAGDHRI